MDLINRTEQEILDIIIDVIVNNKRHKNYDRTVALALDYRAFITGEGLNVKLKQFNPRESELLFKQREMITKHIVPPLCNNLMSVYKQVPQSTSIHVLLEQQNEQRKNDLIEKLDKFYGDLSLEAYMALRYDDLVHLDPNGFIVVEFKETDGKEYASPYPFEVRSEQAIYYLKVNQVLDFLVVMQKINELLVYTIYTKERAIKFVQIAGDAPKDMPNRQLIPAKEETEPALKYYFKNDAVWFKGYVPTPYELSKPPVVELGYIPDNVTYGVTYISPFHNSVPYFEKLIAINSQLDITTHLHAFPQKIQYIAQCKWEGCNGGKLPDGKTCPACNGTGSIQTHSSAQDVISLALPDTADEVLNLDNIIKYIYPPTDLLRFQVEEIKRLIQEAKTTCYNSDIYSREAIAETATKSQIDEKSLSAILYIYGKSYVSVEKNIIELIAEITNLNEGLRVNTLVDKDFHLKSVEDLLNELKLANDSGASTPVIQSINEKLIELTYEDDPVALKKWEIRERFNPFTGKTEQQITQIIGMLPANDRYKTFWLHEGHIFNDAELANPTFYELAFPKQKIIIDKIIDALINDESLEQPNLMDEQPDNQQDNEQSSNNLNQ